MTQSHFIFNSKNIQKIIAESDATQTPRAVLTILFNQLMEQTAHSAYIQVTHYKRNE
ncbi:hypothetical protein ACWN8V_02365 [Vagococcus elongatus]|uniref:hypothetical protein n=1 Tax=Vagococcus elongatus TaxID=180344 RepID=UPI00147703ED|nr:hypothetical protein [Vagococcus elongatus]